MRKMLVFYSGKCSGCHYCEIACSFRHKKVCGRVGSLIKILYDEKNLAGTAFFCRHCQKPLCLELCPVDAIKRNGDTGLVTIDSKTCIGCGLCLECPLGGIVLDKSRGVAVNCDLCQGEPVCVEYCPQGALRYISPIEARFAHASLANPNKGEDK
ncbi:4Fe-4S dicluster domain-containing protein [Chloroflexota bacterium]